MRKSLWIISLLFVAICTPVARAQTYIYTYTGPVFQSFTGVDTAADETNISGEFTLAAPLAPDLPLSFLTPVSFDFTNGYTPPVTSASYYGYEFGVTTTATGAISTWLFQVANAADTETLSSTDISGAIEPPIATTGDESMNEFPSGSGTAFTEDTGTWTCTERTATGAPLPCLAVAPTPEPSSFLLFGTGLLGLLRVMGMGRWRKRLVPS